MPHVDGHEEEFETMDTQGKGNLPLVYSFWDLITLKNNVKRIEAIFGGDSAANSPARWMIQKGDYTLSGGTLAITFPKAFLNATGLVVVCQAKTANHQYPSSITKTGFTANGTAAETGSYIAIGNV